MENEKLSERVEREFKEWKEKYEIPFSKEFQVKTLLKLQEEYDSVPSESNTTRTRETLLQMIERIQHNLLLVSKTEKEDKAMYVECSREKTTIYRHGAVLHYTIGVEDVIDVNGKLKCMTLESCSKKIENIAKLEKTVVYVDRRGIGATMYDLLSQYDSIIVKEMYVSTLSF